jgi:hypothetical protein
MKECLEEDYATHWSNEQSARAHFYLSKLLRVKGKNSEADMHSALAQQVKLRLQKKCGKFFRDDPNDERVVYDLMVPIQDLRLASRVHGASLPWW